MDTDSNVVKDREVWGWVRWAVAGAGTEWGTSVMVSTMKKLYF